MEIILACIYAVLWITCLISFTLSLQGSSLPGVEEAKVLFVLFLYSMLKLTLYCGQQRTAPWIIDRLVVFQKFLKAFLKKGSSSRVPSTTKKKREDKTKDRYKEKVQAV